MTTQEEIKYVEEFIKHVEKGYGKKVCMDTSPSCMNCQAQYVLGWLREHVATLQWELDQAKKEKKK